MEEIREALERAKASDPLAIEQRDARARRRIESRPVRLPTIDAPIQEFEINTTHLQSKRIIAHDHTEPQSTSFDMLRTQVLQSMDQKDWKILGVTSPTPGCGKTVTAINLALSVARQPERSVLLVDLDLRKPQVASCLGLKPNVGVMSVIDGRTTLASAIIPIRIGNSHLAVLPTEAATSGSSDRMASRGMTEMLEQIKRDYQSQFVILDLPPVLSSDDVLAISPQLDCVLLVTAVGTSSVAEINEANKHLQSLEIVRVVLNKVPPSQSKYYYY
ncbi:MAG: CpsD/CapB family tyrosine-protein kinase [Xanthobacteraceae bacterium]